MDTKPLVSIIIPCYNREQYISTAIDSVLNQTYKNVELIVVDDGSSDGSVNVIRSYGDQLTLIEQANTGVSGARNKGLESANGTYIVFLDSDDWFSLNIIEKHVENFLKWPELDATCAGSQFINPDGSSSHIHESNWPDEPSTPVELFLLSPPPFPACVMYKTSTVKKLGGMNQSLKAFEDSELNIRMVIYGGKVAKTNDAYAIYRPVENSLTKKMLKLHAYALEMIKQLKVEFNNNKEIGVLLSERLRRNRMRYWNSIFSYHLSLNPIEVFKFIYQLCKVSWVDPDYIAFILRDKPWKGKITAF